MKRASLAAILVFFIVGLATPVCAQQELAYDFRSTEPSGEAMVADLAFARPMGITALVFGAAASVVALPFSLMTCKTKQMYRKLVVEPYSYTFCRPLGEGM